MASTRLIESFPSRSGRALGHASPRDSPPLHEALLDHLAPNPVHDSPALHPLRLLLFSPPGQVRRLPPQTRSCTPARPKRGHQYLVSAHAPSRADSLSLPAKLTLGTLPFHQQDERSRLRASWRAVEGPAPRCDAPMRSTRSTRVFVAPSSSDVQPPPGCLFHPLHDI